MADRRAPLLAIALASLLAGCATQLPARAHVGYTLSDQQQALRARVLPAPGGHCVDPSTQRLSTAAWQDALRWHPTHTGSARYEGPAIVASAPAASYPQARLKTQTRGAVLVLLLVSRTGAVAGTRAACATDDAFIPAALAVTRDNHYRPATLDGQPVPDVAYQPVVFGF